MSVRCETETTRNAMTVADDFDVFWLEYPKHVAKKDARKAWDRLAPSAALVGQILAAVRWQRHTPAWTKDHGAYVPYPATWLRAERWEDEVFDTRPLLTTYDWNCPHEPHCAHRAACAVVAMRVKA